MNLTYLGEEVKPLCSGETVVSKSNAIHRRHLPLRYLAFHTAIYHTKMVGDVAADIEALSVAIGGISNKSMFLVCRIIQMSNYVLKETTCPFELKRALMHYLAMRQAEPDEHIDSHLQVAMVVVYIIFRHSTLSVGDDFWKFNLLLKFGNCFSGPRYSISTNLLRNNALGVEADLEVAEARFMNAIKNSVNNSTVASIHHLLSSTYGHFVSWDMDKGNFYVKKVSFSYLYTLYQTLDQHLILFSPYSSAMVLRPIPFPHQKFPVNRGPDGNEVIDKARPQVNRTDSNDSVVTQRLEDEDGDNLEAVEGQAEAIARQPVIQDVNVEVRPPIVQERNEGVEVVQMRPGGELEHVGVQQEDVGGGRPINAAPGGFFGQLISNRSFVLQTRWGIAGGIGLYAAPGAEVLQMNSNHVGIYVRQVKVGLNLQFDLDHYASRLRYQAGIRLGPLCPELNDAAAFVIGGGENPSVNDILIVKLFLADFLGAMVALGTGMRPGTAGVRCEIERWDPNNPFPADAANEIKEAFMNFFGIPENALEERIQKMVSLSSGLNCVVQAYANYMRSGTTENGVIRIKNAIKKNIISFIEHLGIGAPTPNFMIMVFDEKKELDSSNKLVMNLVSCVYHRMFAPRKKDIFPLLILNQAKVNELKIPITSSDHYSLNSAPIGTSGWSNVVKCYMAHGSMGSKVTVNNIEEIRRVAAILEDGRSFEKIKYSSIYKADFDRDPMALPIIPNVLSENAGAMAQMASTTKYSKMYAELSSGPVSALSLKKLSTNRGVKSVR